MLRDCNCIESSHFPIFHNHHVDILHFLYVIILEQDYSNLE